jgi:predicted glycosyltransferase
MITPRRFFLYSHDGQGLGHARRHLAIARGIVEADPTASVLIATGIEELPKPGLPPNVEVLKLPSLRKMANGRYESRRLLLAPRETRALRSSLLLTAVKSFRPHVVLADKHPFGASGEFRHALAAARRMGARAALGLRDILDDPATVRREWRPHGLPYAIADHYDEVLIYGERDVFDAAMEYDFPPSLASRSHYCGYVINPPPRLDRPRRERPLVLATAGAGEDGFHILATFLQASVDAPWQALAVSGPHCPPEHSSRLAELAAAANAEWHTFVPALESRIASADAVVCMGGYNTIGETLASGVPTVCIPRVVPRREQLIRARAFEKLGLLRVITPDALTPERLRAGLAEALLSTPNTAALDFSGASHSAQRLLALADAAIAQMNGEPAYA